MLQDSASYVIGDLDWGAPQGQSERLAFWRIQWEAPAGGPSREAVEVALELLAVGWGCDFAEYFNIVGVHKTAWTDSGRKIVNPRLTGGGAFDAPPLPNVRDSSKTNSAIDMKLGRPSHTTIWHRLWFFFELRRKFFEIWSILWRHYTPLLVENWPNFAGLWKTYFLMKMQMKNTKRRKTRSSKRWLSQFFKTLGFWPLKCQKIDFFSSKKRNICYSATSRLPVYKISSQ